MKKLLKSEICGSREQCMRPTNMLEMVEKSNNAVTVLKQCINSNCLSPAMHAKKKKKKKRIMQDSTRQMLDVYPNPR